MEITKNPSENKVITGIKDYIKKIVISQGGPRSWEISLPTGEYPISDNREFPSVQGNGKFSILNLGY